ncbi:MAG: hypothetical protein HUU15_11995 [Candidatus Brocadiae bacterium]|nr:hypothetical protein [Candidatus Brocadiia bacterium]
MRTLTLLVLVLSAAGCRLEPPNERYWAEPVAEDSHWKAGHKTVWDEKRRVIGFVEYQDSEIRDEALGEDAYLRETQRQTHRAYFVKDSEYNVLGFISETGNTYRFRSGAADYTHVGNYTIQDGIRALLGTNATIELLPTRLSD